MMQASGAVNLRGLKALVIGLGILVVLGTALVIGVAVKRLLVSTAPEAHQAAHLAANPPVPGSAPFATTLPKGRIAGIAAANGMVAIRLRDGAGGKVVFVDPRTGAVAGTAAPSR
ncbi:MAG: hypothetical protein ACYCZB_11635 [Acidiphilium sp.]